MKLYKFAFIPFAFLAVACGEDGTSIDLNGKTPEQQADTVADASCAVENECEIPTFEIGFDPETEATTCDVTFAAGDYDACYEDFHDTALSIFQTCSLSDADLDKIEQCFNAQSAQGCVSEAEANDYCDQYIAGSEDPELSDHPYPAVCDEVDALIESCQPPQ